MLNKPDPVTEVDVVIEIPRGSFLKRGTTGEIDFLSPFPCPFNYGSVHEFIGGEGDLLDALVLGPRLPIGTRVTVQAYGAVGLTDRDIYDDKLVCHDRQIKEWQRKLILLFFQFYAFCKRFLNIYRGYAGRTVCEGWCDAGEAIERAVPNNQNQSEQKPEISF